MEKRVWLSLLTLVVVVGFLVSFAFLFSKGGLTGFATYSESSQSDFDLGTYENTSYNGSAVVLSGSNLTGYYTSKIFDAGNDATWNSLTYSGNTPSVEQIFAVDNQADVWKSSDAGATWSIVKDDYNSGDGNGVTASFFNNSKDYFILYNQDLWATTDSGLTFTKVNDDYNGAEGQNAFVATADKNNNIFIIEGDQDVWKSIDSGSTFTKVSTDFNGGNGNIFGLVSDSSNNLYSVDNQADVWKSSDAGTTWTLVKDDYNGAAGNNADGMAIDSNNFLYILDLQDVWKSIDSGTSWTKVNDDFNGAGDAENGKSIITDSSNNVYVIDGGEDVFKSIDSGATFTKVATNFNGANGITPTMAVVIQQSNLTFQVINCTQSDCSDGTWQTLDLNSINLVSRYFQYKASFTSPDTSISPSLESTIINYDLLNTAPTITLVAPQEGASFGTNQSLSLNFIASDADSNIDSCWYKIDSGSNIIIANCANTTFDVAEGSHTLTVYVNDTEGEQASDSATFSVSVGAPTILLNSPIDSYLNSQAVIFRYTPTDVNLASCELWGDFAGSFALNQTNANPTSGSENIFSLNLADGTYLWNIRCNDSAGNSAFNGNKTFYVDITNPALSLSQPIGTKTSRTGISLTFTITDASPTSCLYNIKWSTGESVIANTTIANCLSTTFSVAADGNYVLNLYINDSAGNTNSTNSSFSVDTSTPSTPPSTPPTGGSGGGSGGSSFPPNKSEFSMSLSDLGEVIMKPGESKSLSLEARNTGTKMQNNCKISSSGWISGSEENDLNANELAGFVFTVEVPQDAETGDYDLSVVLKCQDGEKNAILKISILEGDIGVSIKEIKEINKNKILFSYIIRELAGKNIDATLNFVIVDVDGNKIAENSASVSLSALEEKELDAEIEVPAGTSGEYELIVEVSSEGASVRDKTNVLITGTGIAGFAGFLNMSETNKKYLSIAILIGVAGLLGFFIVRRIVRSMGKESSRKGVIKVDKKIN